MTTTVVTKVIKTEQGIQVAGALVFANVSSLLEQSSAYFKQYQNDTFMIDCSAIDRIDSAGIALLIEWQRSCTSNNKSCHFAGLSNQAQSLIEAYHLESLIAS